LLEQCIASGYRNSGISLGSSKIIVVKMKCLLFKKWYKIIRKKIIKKAVRSTQNIECPVTVSGKLIVDHEVTNKKRRKS
jgi:hypothetical protein